jgi:hypothetical protein
MFTGTLRDGVHRTGACYLLRITRYQPEQPAAAAGRWKETASFPQESSLQWILRLGPGKEGVRHRILPG